MCEQLTIAFIKYACHYLYPITSKSQPLDPNNFKSKKNKMVPRKYLLGSTNNENWGEGLLRFLWILSWRAKIKNYDRKQISKCCTNSFGNKLHI